MKRNRFSPALLAAIPAAAAFLLHGPLLDWNLRLGDEGYLVYGVERLVEGEVLYRDVVRHYMPGVYYIFVPLFDWFGPSLTTVRLVWLGWLAALCGGTCLLLRPLAPPWIAVLAGLLTALVPPPSHKTFVPAMVLLGLACCRSLLRPSISFRRALGVGAALGAVALFRQEVAAFCLAIGAVTVGVRLLAAAQRRDIVVAATGVSTGLAIVWAPVLTAFAAAGALLPMFEQVVLTASAANAGMGLPFPAPLAGGAPFYFPATAAALGVTIAAIAALRRRFGEAHALLLQWSALTALMHALVLQRSDVPHLTQILLAPTLILVGLLGLCWRAMRDAGAPRPRRLLAALGASILSAVVVALGTWGLRTEILPDYREKRQGVSLGEERARVVVDPLLANEARQILDYLRERTRPGEPIFVVPYSPMYYFLADRPNATRHDFVLPVTNSSRETQREIRDALDAAGVRVVLIRDVAIDGVEDRRFPRYTPWLADYFAIEFERDRRIGSWICLVRRGSR